MKTVNTILMLLFAGVMLGQDVKPKTIQVSVDTQNKILLAERKLDQVILKRDKIQSDGNKLQQEWVASDSELKTAIKEVNDANDLAFKDGKVSKNDYDFNPANFTLTEKDKKSETPETQEKK